VLFANVHQSVVTLTHTC